MNGDEVLRNIIAERLRELDSIPDDMRSAAAGRIVAFCLGAADALTKAGLLPQGHPEALDRLYSEFERRGFGQRIAVTMEARESVSAQWSDDSEIPPG